ncbi:MULTISPECIES: sigma-54 dependent transcriptional regulator [unclassified Azospirillum]|uniref:sigma-54-dependent transcriptional regulator n=1 Tax=unclassified Azospirillum TaxID=2630922 RepID=UPI000B6C0D53|nr:MULTISPECIES: sigma-54 dependent transcriptional regulator [unclassified Azospirillum]SNS46612.1 two-component system, NtrC family, C4-dicarboxylate transport response regulator DctD [Azospirillum sp. RU38E]SNS65784.1 two-component system, NtrC family, C4-dicarboxylate transport response regulator DctD [Azospirillum sp. RU37A]
MPRPDLQVLFIDDEEMIRRTCRQTLELAGIKVRTFAGAAAALAELGPDFPGIIVTDVRLPEMDGMELLARCRTLDPELPVVLITGHGDVAMAVRAIREGAWDFIEKPFLNDHFLAVVQRALAKRALVRENRRLRRALDGEGSIARYLLGQSAGIGRVRDAVANLAGTDVDVLILGETGAGKEQVARALHDGGNRAALPFVAINCGAIPDSMFESEMFGHEAGAFTGAAKRRIGKIEHAGAGTLFLDEVESMPLALQVKLLRVLQDRTLERLGGNAAVPVRCRVVAATKVDLKQLADAGRFRLDLYYRLNVVTIPLPPLRERRDDIPQLFEHFVLQAAGRYQRSVPDVPPALVRQLMLRDWPGNVRELRNAADRFVLGMGGPDLTEASTAPLSLPDLLDQVERQLIQEALRGSGGQVTGAATALGVARKTLYDKMKRLGLAGDG